MINRTKEDVASRCGVLLYYFCGADPTVDQYSHVRNEASSKAIAMTFLRQVVSTYYHRKMAGLDHYSMAGLGEVVDYVLSSGPNMLSEQELRRQVAKLLKSFDTVRCVYCLPLLMLLLTLASFVFKGSS